jgi:Zn-finger nucleic acid-binding protein
MDKYEWILCPICGQKTRIKIRKDTELKNFPLFCPKCKQETLINIMQLNITVITAPDTKMQSR